MSAPFVHPTAIVEPGVRIGDGSAIWDNAHLRTGSVVGRDCIVGGKAYLAPEVSVGDRCKINAMAYLCSGVTLGAGVMVAAQVTFTNDRYPRACGNDLQILRPSDVDELTGRVTVEDGATIGAGATIGSDLVIGRFAMVGMGSVVTSSVPGHTLVVGNPARPIGLVCRCGRPLDTASGGPFDDGALRCAPCEAVYTVRAGIVVADSHDRSGQAVSPA